MRYAKLPRAKEEISCITMGTWAIGGNGWGDVDDDVSVDAIHAMIEQGVNLIDCAPPYGFGHAEEVLGRAIASRRGQVRVLTKFGSTWPNGPEKGLVRNNSRQSCFDECEKSLRRLQVDCIDYYLVHWPDPNVEVEETMAAMVDLQKQGKIRHIGVSNFPIDLLERAMQVANVVVNQLPFSMLNRHAEDTMAWCKAHDIGIITYGSLGSGLLSGKVRVNPKYEITDVRGRFYGKYYEDEMFAKIMRLVDTLDAIAQARGVPISQVAVNWSAQHPLVDSPIMGVRTRAHALENTAAMDWTLTPEEIARIDSRIDETVGRGADVIHKTHVQKK